MKKSIIAVLVFTVAFGFISCRDGSGENKAEEAAKENKETTHTDSLSEELETTIEAIEIQTKVLQEALEAL